MPRIKIEHLARIEGSAGLEVVLDPSGRVQEVILKSEIFRGFERFVRGRPALEMPFIAGRICGICAEAHTLASLQALDEIFSTRPSANVVRIRKIYFLSGFLRDHLTVVSLFGAPDFGGERKSSTALSFLKESGRLRPFLRLREKLNRTLELISGRSFQGVGGLPGDWARALSKEEVQEIRRLAERIRKETRDYALSLVREFSLGETLPPRPLLALEGGFTEGPLALFFPGGRKRKFKDYRKVLREEEPQTDGLRPTHLFSGEAYLVGPLARFFLWPPPEGGPEDLQARLRECLEQQEGRPVELPHLLRIYECLLAARELEKTAQALKPHRPSAEEKRPQKAEGLGLVEAPRGLLVHHYRVDEKGYLQQVNILTPTAQNVKALKKDLEKSLEGFKPKNFQKLAEQAEKVVRSYDPCIPCMLHIMIPHNRIRLFSLTLLNRTF
ncbi:hypothetical protein FVE67_04840 [Thermosulfurimonas marina]|uniref:Ni/Fe hydrogenase subunit alpha n=1 Tax=Thermosulfurimonas marina TaxID=2047767 RepID=A0A6H1WSR2_9BACT|nr:nickel-dependent hydrogenase large subunit [Thermosulfurimonas marina]QJA06166.1 hypothetical protein FVE67_04840 [Thermosulfurimonas marina]